MEPQVYKKRQSIKWRLILAFTVVSVVAVGSALHAWFFMGLSRNKIQTVTEKTLPLVSSAQNLSREVSLFSMGAAELPRIGEERQRRDLLTNLQERMVRIDSQLQILWATGFEPMTIRNLQQDVQALLNNLVAQTRLAADFLHLHEQLQGAVAGLTKNHHEFVIIAQPRIAAEHNDFLVRGRQIVGGVRNLLYDDKGLGDSQKIVALDQKIRVGIETLLSSEADEMRANLELMALTYQVAGIFHEAANVSDRLRVAELKRQFVAVLPDLNRIRLILGEAPPEDRKLLASALPVIRYGMGEGSIFAMRDRELQLRAQAAESTLHTLELSDKLSKTTDALTTSGNKLAATVSEELDHSLKRGLYLQVVIVLLVIILSIVIGYHYVGRRIISRIHQLQIAMEEQAAGNDVPIPVGGDDEIGRMAGSLKSFVRHRALVEKELREVVDSLHEAKKIAQLGNFEHRVESGRWFWSEVFQELIGRTAEKCDADEKEFWLLIHQEDHARLERSFERAAVAPGETVETIVRLKRDDGELRTVQLFVRDNGMIGTPEHLQVGTLQDITERVRMEEELLQAKKMESLGTLAGGIRHDFNNIMTGVMGNVSLAKRLLEPGHELEELLENAEKATRRARDLTARLLAFTETTRPVCSATHLPNLIKAAAELVLSGTGVTCTMDVGDGLLPVAMDPGQMSSVVQNLVENSLNALEGRGCITISCHNEIIPIAEANLQGLGSGSYVRIEVIDCGQGISDENLNRVFDPYFTTRQRDSYKGRGLGLAICRAVIVRHGGSISVTSEPGVKTVFTVWLPTFAKRHDDDATKEVVAETKTLDILLMDDEQLVRDIAQAMLDHLGYKVTTAQDGREAIALYEARLSEGRPFDLVIMDLTVPGGMGGVETAEYMQKQHPDAILVVSSGYSTDPVVENYQAYGFRDTISKPYAIGEFQNALQRLEEMVHSLQENV